MKSLVDILLPKQLPFSCCFCPIPEEPCAPSVPTTYDPLLGRIQCWRGRAFRVRDAQNKTFFVDKLSLVRHCVARHGHDGQRLAAHRGIRRAVLRAVAPNGDWRGTSLQNLVSMTSRIWEQISHLESLSEGPLDPAQVIQTIEAINPRALPPIQVDDLIAGDIIFTRVCDDVDPNVWESAVSKAQKYTRFMLPGPRDRDMHHIIHVGIYLGNGRLAEAMLASEKEAEMRIVDIREHPYYRERSHTYIVSRVQDTELAQSAAAIAEQLCDDPSEWSAAPWVRRYNMGTAVMSVVRPPWELELASLHRVIEGYHRLEHPEERWQADGFHCSYLVPYVFQLAEARRIMPDLAKKHALSPHPEEGSTVDKIGDWIGDRLQQLRSNVEIPFQLQERMLFKINAKATSPQELRMFLMRLEEEGTGRRMLDDFRLELARNEE